MPIAQTRLETLQICKLLQCVRENEQVKIEKLCHNGVPHLINYNEPKDGETALHIAAVANNETMIEFLLSLGAHPDVVDFKGRSAVMRAAEYGHVQCLEILAKRGADMKLKDLEGKGILFYCISSTQRHQECLNIAVLYQADVNNKNKDGLPVFLKACETAAENEDMCLMMLKKGADPNSKHDKFNRTALMAAANSGSSKVVRTILERGADINQLTNRTRLHAAHFAAKGGFFEVLTIMSAFGANFDQYDDQLNSPVHFAAQGGHAMCCKFLAQRGCNPKPKNNDGEPAKNIAKENGHKEAMKELKKVEKSFGKTGKNNEPWAIALYDFCMERQTQLKDMFRKFDADGMGVVGKDDFIEGLQNVEAPLPNDADMKKILTAHDKNKDGLIDYNDFLGGKKYINKQYLMSAFDGKKKKKKGGKKGKKGKTKIPMPICTQADGPRAEDGGPPEIFVPMHMHHTDVGRFDRDEPPRHPLQDDSAWYLHSPNKVYVNVNEAVKHTDTDTLKDAIIRGFDVDMKDKYYKTPLMIACAYGNLTMVKFLVERGANVNATDNFKWTPLHFACHSGLKDVVEYLLDKGANLEATTINGGTPFLRAVESSRPDVVQYLIDKGCKVQVENKKGHNPCDIAAAFGDARVYDIVRTKYDSLPPPSDKKKGGKGAKKATGKRPASGAGGDDGRPTFTGRDGADSPGFEGLNRNRKGSILRAASALAGGIEEKEDITYVPLKVWTDQPTTEDMLCQREQRRERFTWEVDFPDFKMPFQKNIALKVEEMGPDEDDDD